MKTLVSKIYIVLFMSTLALAFSPSLSQASNPDIFLGKKIILETKNLFVIMNDIDSGEYYRKDELTTSETDQLHKHALPPDNNHIDIEILESDILRNYGIGSGTIGG